MHPSLGTAALCSLPSPIQKSAYAAAAGTPADFIALLRAIEGVQNVPKSIWTLLLPVYYAHLDPTKARQLQQRGPEVLGPADADLVVLAFLAVQGFTFAEQISEGACLDIWRGLWPWLQVLTQHHYCLPEPAVITRSIEAPLLAFSVIWRIYRFADSVCREIIAAEPGIRVMIARVWAGLSNTDPNSWSPGFQTDGFDSAVHLIRLVMDLGNPEHHDDLVEGTGGSLGDLATVIVNFVTQMVTEDTEKSAFFLSSTRIIIKKTEEVRDGFRHLLLERGITTALVIAVRKLSAQTSETHDDTMEDGLQLLVSMFFQRRSQVWFVEALRVGFLRLMAWAFEAPNFNLIARDLLEVIVPDGFTLFLPYRSVLIQLPSALADMDAHMDRTLAEQSPVWDAWDSGFMGWYDWIVPMLQVHDSSDRVPMRACDNVKCNFVSAKVDLKRCSCCESVYYCSKECQRVDWRRGHRKTCVAIRSYSLKNPDPLTARDRSFIHTMVNQIYKTKTLDILIGQLAIMKEAPERECTTIIKYVDGNFVLEPIEAPLSHLDLGNISLGPMWDDQLSRAAASNQQIHLLLIGLTQGPGRPLGKVVAVRRRSKTVGERLIALAQEIPDGMGFYELKSNSETRAKVDALIRETGAAEVVY